MFAATTALAVLAATGGMVPGLALEDRPEGRATTYLSPPPAEAATGGPDVVRAAGPGAAEPSSGTPSSDDRSLAGTGPQDRTSLVLSSSRHRLLSRYAGDVPSYVHAGPLVVVGLAMDHPVAGPLALSSAFGWRINPTDVGPAVQFHIGQDYAVACGTPVHAAGDGTVTGAGDRGTGGLRVDIAHDGGLATSYRHNSRLLVSAGDTVTRGEVIALSGTTGNSTGCHLHFDITVGGQYVDPALLLPGVPGQPRPLTAQDLERARADAGSPGLRAGRAEISAGMSDDLATRAGDRRRDAPAVARSATPAGQRLPAGAADQRRPAAPVKDPRPPEAPAKGPASSAARPKAPTPTPTPTRQQAAARTSEPATVTPRPGQSTPTAKPTAKPTPPPAARPTPPPAAKPTPTPTPPPAQPATPTAPATPEPAGPTTTAAAPAPAPVEPTTPSTPDPTTPSTPDPTTPATPDPTTPAPAPDPDPDPDPVDPTTPDPVDPTTPATPDPVGPTTPATPDPVDPTIPAEPSTPAPGAPQPTQPASPGTAPEAAAPPTLTAAEAAQWCVPTVEGGRPEVTAGLTVTELAGLVAALDTDGVPMPVSAEVLTKVAPSAVWLDELPVCSDAAFLESALAARTAG